MIKFALRHNLIYPLQLLLWSNLREIERTLISYFFGLNSLLIYTPLMFLGEFFAGAIFYLYQKKFLSRRKKGKRVGLMPIEFVRTKHKFTKDRDTKILFLIFTSAFSDFIQFLVNLQLHKFMTISGSLEQRLRGSFTINNAFFYYYALKLPIFKHQFFSLTVIGICLFIIILTEFIFQEFNIFLTLGQFFLALLLIFIIQYASALEESIEKYLYEYNQLSPFLVLLLQGIFGLIFSLIYCYFHDPFKDIIQFKNTKKNSEFIILIFTLVLYLILSGGKNLFRVVTTKIYSPMTTTFIEYMLNPFYNIYYFASGSDFISYGKLNVLYFIINLIISIITTFCGGVYNEFIILFFCKLEYETHGQIVKRARTETEFVLFNEGGEEEDEDLMSV